MPDAPVIDPAAPPVDPPPVADPPTPPTPPADPPADPPAGETPDQTIARLEDEVKKARNEAGKSRINAKQTAADEARAELAQTIGKALGLVEDETVDPAKLLEQVTASQAQAHQATVELAVFRAADAAGGDPVALLDSRAFLEKVAEIKPDDSAALTAAITAAVGDNPRLGKASAPVQPGMQRNPAQGSSSSPPLGIDAQIAAAEAAGDTRLAIRLKSAQSVNTQ